MECIELLLEICIKCAYHKKIKIKDKYKQKINNQSNVHNSGGAEEYSQAQNTNHYLQQLINELFIQLISNESYLV